MTAAVSNPPAAATEGPGLRLRLAARGLDAVTLAADPDRVLVYGGEA